MAAYRGEAAGNGTKAAVLAGYARVSAAVMASRLLRKANVQAEIANHVSKSESTSILTAAERDEILSVLAKTAESTGDRIRAISELNKCSGRHMLKLGDLDGKPLTPPVTRVIHTFTEDAASGR